MKKTVKLVAAVLAAALMLSAFAGCALIGKKDDNTLIMATNAAFPPYEYYDGDTVIGIDAEIAAAIAKELGKELLIEDIDFDSIISTVQGGKADFGMAGMTVTEERLKNINFSDTYAKGIQVVIVPENSPITTVDDIFADGAAYSIGVQTGTTGDIYITGDIEGTDNKVERYNNGNDAVLALANGQIDCVVIDNEPAKAFVAKQTGLKILDSAYAEEEYAIAIAKDNTELLDQVNDALAKLTEDGTIDAIIGKYIKAE